jgi:DNA modification methylase
MKAYPPSAIQVRPNRQRSGRDPEKQQELHDSIDGKRLLHAIVVEEVDGVPWLIAGEGRLTVIKDIFALGGYFWYDGVKYTDKIPTVEAGELDELEREELELDENIRREDLSWQDRADAHTRLHSLRQKQAAKAPHEARKSDNGSPGNEGILLPKTHTIADTAKEVFGRSEGGYQDIIRKELIVAQHLNDPAVAKAKDLKTAFKIVKQKEADQRHAAHALSVGATFSSKDHEVYNADCLQWMAEESAGAPRKGMFDIILTDPLYGMGADEFSDGGGKMIAIEHNYKDDYETWKEVMSKWCKLAFDITKPQAHAYVFCDFDRFHELKGYMQVAGWYVHRTPIIVHKLDATRVPLPNRGPRRCWEMCLYAIKGDMEVTAIYADVIPCRGDENMGHGAQKPVELFHNLLMRSARPGMRVLDTFGGTGTLLPAAHQLKLKATVVEMDKASYGKCLARLKLLAEQEGVIDLEGM